MTRDIAIPLFVFAWAISAVAVLVSWYRAVWAKNLPVGRVRFHRFGGVSPFGFWLVVGFLLILFSASLAIGLLYY